MTALAPGEIRARRRPLVLAALVLARLALGLCLASPLAALVAESGVGQRAEGDRALFESGGYLLLEVARLQGAAFTATVRGLLPLLVLGWLLNALGNAALLVALNTGGPLRSLAWLGPAFARLPALCAVGVVTALGQGLLLLAGAILAGGAPESMTSPQTGTALQLAVWLTALLAASALGGFADVAKAGLVRHDRPLLVALPHTWHVVRMQPFFGLFGWVPYAVPFALAALGAAWLTGLLDVSQSGAWRVAAVFALHQSVIVVAVMGRAAWFARALRGVCRGP